ncbi:uncharacterized protein [Eucyclogobius newberryi]|uniref:uncharacterized protein n=1 Tax=Eucyclogobius newberryi TaxID=166745 RepID=UPI003B5AF025
MTIVSTSPHATSNGPFSVTSTTEQTFSTSTLFTPTSTTNQVTPTTCQEFVYGDNCIYGFNNTQPIIDNGGQLTRKVNITLVINIIFDNSYLNLNSPESKHFSIKLVEQLEPLCRKADPNTFKSIEVIRLSAGSVLAETEVSYKYVNSESQIQYVNNQLETVLTNILNDTTNLNNIGAAFNTSTPHLKTVTFESPSLTNITQLEPYINCTNFADYTKKLINGSWTCVGPCDTIPNYCNRHGDCYNHIILGPICFCYNSSMEQYHGARCELFSWGQGFYGALFGSLAAAFLLLCIIIIAAVAYRRRRHAGIWTRRDSSDGRLSAFEEDFFNYRGDHNLGFSNT